MSIAPSNATVDEFLTELNNDMVASGRYEYSDCKRTLDIAIMAEEWSEDEDRVSELEGELEELDDHIKLGVDLIGLIRTTLDDDHTHEELVAEIKNLINTSDF